MNASLFTDLQTWFLELLKDHTQLLNRPIILIDETLIQQENDTGRYYFINPKNQKQFGLVVTINNERFLLLFIQLKFILAFVDELLSSNYPFNVKMIETRRYQCLFEIYSKGKNELETDVLDDVTYRT